MTGSASATILSACTNRLRHRECSEPRGEAAPQAPSLKRLPSPQRWQSNRQIACAFQQRKCYGHLRRQPKGAAEQYIGSLFNANRRRNRTGDGADRIEQALDHKHCGEVKPPACKAKGDPNLNSACHPAGEVKKEALP